MVSSVAMPVLGGSKYELWVVDALVDYRRQSDWLEIAVVKGYALVRVQMPTSGGKSLQEAAYEAYEAVFAQAKTRKMSLLRAWHWIPRILEEVGGLENYRWHNVGRQEAWKDFGPWQDGESVLPAATGIGVQEGPYVLEVLLTKYPVIPLQNPRQVPFHRYSSKFGPKPPFCSRGALHLAPEGPEVWISGTASIRNQYSWWKDNPREQVKETFRNIRALIGDANLEAHGVKGFSLENLAHHRAYVKRPEHYAVISEELNLLVGDGSRCDLQTDVCRQELEFEFEAIAR
ncbi:MAG TPA: hypothetical protein VGE59_02845 [Patescibacteria group bacterium]